MKYVFGGRFVHVEEALELAIDADDEQLLEEVGGNGGALGRDIARGRVTVKVGEEEGHSIRT